jgi:hypothetical protein
MFIVKTKMVVNLMKCEVCRKDLLKKISYISVQTWKVGIRVSHDLFCSKSCLNKFYKLKGGSKAKNDTRF